LGVKAITDNGRRVRFYSTIDLVTLLEREKAAGNQGKLAYRLMQVDRVILDERGYLPFSQAGSALLFHLLSKLSATDLSLDLGALPYLLHPCKSYERTSIFTTCLKWVDCKPMNNPSIRERFGIEEQNKAQASRIIKETVDAGLIRSYDSGLGVRSLRYVPIWS